MAKDRLLAPEGTCRVQNCWLPLAPEMPVTGTPSSRVPSPGGGGGGGSLPPSKNEYSSRFGEPLPGLVTLFGVEALMIALVTCDGVAVGLSARYSAATPATCGEANEVPLMVLVAEVLVYQAEVMDEPGAKMSRHEP